MISLFKAKIKGFLVVLLYYVVNFSVGKAIWDEFTVCDSWDEDEAN